ADGAADLGQADVAALHVRREAAQHLAELLLVGLLVFGEFPGANQTLEAGMLRDDRQVHQLQAAGQGQGDRGAGDQGERSGAAQRDPVVLDVERFLDVVRFLAGSVGAGSIRQSGSAAAKTHQMLTLTWPPTPGALLSRPST